MVESVLFLVTPSADHRSAETVFRSAVESAFRRGFECEVVNVRSHNAGTVLHGSFRFAEAAHKSSLARYLASYINARTETTGVRARPSHP